jgi:hypothetical protein
MSGMETENQKLKQELNTVKTENIELKERLKKYTAPERGLNYYHKNKERIAEYKKEYYQKQKAEKEKNKTG